MRVVQYQDVTAFAARAMPLLTRNECENCLVIGAFEKMASSSTAACKDLDNLMLSIEDDGEICGVALHTPPLPMLLTRLDDGMIDLLAQELLKNKWRGEGLTGPSGTCDSLASTWTNLTGRARHRHGAFSAFQLTDVLSPRPAPGQLVQATAEHLDIVANWRGAFAQEINDPDDDPRSRAERILAQRRYYLWADGQPCAMAAIAGPTPSGIRINQVYTPPDRRGRGYASNLVACLSQHMLDSGRKFCFLFADHDNPTSNKIYQQIGFRRVADFQSWIFTANA